MRAVVLLLSRVACARMVQLQATRETAAAHPDDRALAAADLTSMLPKGVCK